MLIEAGVLVAVVFGALKARQHAIRQKFLDEHQWDIYRQNQELADEWRATKPVEKRMVIKREITISGVRIKHKQKFYRDRRPWHVRWFCD